MRTRVECGMWNVVHGHLYGNGACLGHYAYMIYMCVPVYVLRALTCPCNAVKLHIHVSSPLSTWRTVLIDMILISPLHVRFW
jgi:hypothetical protein